MTTLTLTVTTSKHPDAVEYDDPGEIREIGFKVTAILSSDKPVSSTLQESYRLEQWVTDKYWLQTRSDETSNDWSDGEEEGTKWERDQFGEDDDKGEWDSTKTKTTFFDEPGFLGKDARNGRALTREQRLGDYEISFKWKIYNGKALVLETEVITLKAEPDDEGHITYTPDVERTWSVNV